MPRIKCHYSDCVFIDEGVCSAAAVELDPDEGCKTYSPAEDAGLDDEWDDEEESTDEWDDEEGEEEDEEWLDDEDEF